MQDNRYTLTHFDESNPLSGKHLDSESQCIYIEECWKNYSSESICLIDNLNSKYVLDSTMHYSQGYIDCVECNVRFSLNAPSSRNNFCNRLKGYTIKITLNELRKGPVYIKELDRLICLPSESNSANHPYSFNNLLSLKEELVRRYKDQIDQGAHVMFLANDPKCRLDKLYASIDNNVIEINVTDIPSESMKCELSMLIVTENNDITLTNTYDIEEIFSNSDGVKGFATAMISCIGTTIGSVKHYNRLHRLYTQEELDKEIKRAEYTIINQYKAELAAKDTMINNLKNQNIILQNSLNDIQSRYDSLLQQIKASVDYNNLNFKQNEMENKMKTSATEAKETEFKYQKEVICGIVGFFGMLAGLGIKILCTSKK